jgi:hypothetical protein
MKKFAKVFFITLTSLVLLLLISVSVLSWVVFTPERLTPVIRKQTGKYIPYKTEIGEVELTLFSTFPQFGIRVNKFAVISPLPGSPCDTLIKAGSMTGVIDARAYWKNRELIVNRFIVSDSHLNIFSDIHGQTNYSLFVTGSGEETGDPVEPADMATSLIDLKTIQIKNLNISFIDQAAELNASVRGLDAGISGTVSDENINGRLDIDKAVVSFEHGGEKLIDQARVKLSLPAHFMLPGKRVELKEAFASINGMGMVLDGSLEIDAAGNNILTDLDYQFNSWQIKEILALIPPSYLAELEGTDISGIISSGGTIRGIFNDSLMPVIDITFSLAGGAVEYAGLPFVLRDINGEAELYADRGNDSANLRLNSFEARTPNSVFRTKGEFNHLFADIHCNLTAEANILLDEFRQLIPDDLNLTLSGRANGQVTAGFTMSQAENMELDKMKLSGSAVLSDFTMVHDTMTMTTCRTRIDFSLPNPYFSGSNPRFASVKIASENLAAAKTDDFNTSLKNGHLYLELSDIRDTTVTPGIFCTFSFDSFLAGMDTIGLAIVKPLGYFSISPVLEGPGQAGISLGYTSYEFAARKGSDFVIAGDININTGIIIDNTKEDMFQQWLANGFVDMKDGILSMSSFPYPVEIPAVKMDFNPETFTIHESRLKIDRTDFALSGALNNVLSYFRGDSILRGDFDFVSENTDIIQLMTLTSGLGDEEDAVQNPSTADNSEFSNGPYMVPKGVDIILRTDVRQALRGTDTITDLTGNVRVYDGILLLEDIAFTTPAAKMLLTAMYRTPRKNHLYLGLDYHMMDVEIGRLLQMLPDLDTIMPMLRSFAGRGEFHIAIETYLDSLYNVKKSTLRGASSIAGQNLVLMDGETFSDIAQTLRFSKKAENLVDSLSAEFTVFRNNIYVFPFLMVLDRYRVVIDGGHSFDMRFKYHITVVDSPLPFRLGINIIGDNEEMEHGLTAPKYPEYYRPVSRHEVQNSRLELRRMIREALMEKVVEEKTVDHEE